MAAGSMAGGHRLLVAGWRHCSGSSRGAVENRRAANVGAHAAALVRLGSGCGNRIGISAIEPTRRGAFRNLRDLFLSGFVFLEQGGTTMAILDGTDCWTFHRAGLW